MRIRWKVIPKNEPVVIKTCPKCGAMATFKNSGKFRINANQSKLDVWLIYECEKCKATWNMTILTRVNPKEINRELYQKFLENNQDLARTYAFDLMSHKQNKVTLNYDQVAFEVIGEDLKLEALKEPTILEVYCEEGLAIRLDKLLSNKLGISRNQFKKLVEAGYIQGEKDLIKAKLKGSMTLTLNPLEEGKRQTKFKSA